MIILSASDILQQTAVKILKNKYNKMKITKHLMLYQTSYPSSFWYTRALQKLDLVGCKCATSQNKTHLFVNNSDSLCMIKALCFVCFSCKYLLAN